MRRPKIGTGLIFVRVALIAFCLGCLAAGPRDHQESILMSDPAPERWCVFQETGHMTGFSRAVIRTNGEVLGWTSSETLPFNSPPDFRQKLTAEEKRYLEMWLEVTDFMNLNLLRLGNDADTFLQVYQDGKTNLVQLNYPQFDALFYCFRKITSGGKDGFRLRMQRMLNLKVSLAGYEEEMTLLKSYLKGPKRADCASEALRVLSLAMPAKEWGEFVRRCLEGATTTQRKILVEAIESSEWNLRSRLSEDYRQQMSR